MGKKEKGRKHTVLLPPVGSGAARAVPTKARAARYMNFIVDGLIWFGFLEERKRDRIEDFLTLEIWMDMKRRRRESKDS